MASLASLLLPLFVWLATVLQAPSSPWFVWLEGESPIRASEPLKSQGWGRSDYLSGQKWLFAAVDPDQVAKQVPAEGLSIRYDFTVPSAGKYEVWARLGYEFARSPFRWRVGAAEWTTVAPDTLTTDLMAIADFAEVAWLKLGTVDVAQGAHPLEFNIPKPEKPGARILFGLDCVCVSRGDFRPNGPSSPGANWKNALDREAEKTGFEFPAPARNQAPESRRVLSLGGTWQIARDDENDITDRTGPVKLPKNTDDLFWKGIRVPGDKDAERPDLAYCHRYFYRTTVAVPANFAGRSFVLRFPNNALISTVFVNGQQVGFSKTPCASFDCDATAAIKPGATNEIVVGIKDLYYAVAKTGEGKSCRYLFNYPHEKFHAAGGLGPTRFADFPVLFKVRRNGILETPSLIVGGPVYSADVFCIPSVSKKQLGLEITLHNPTANPVEVELRNEVRAIPALVGSQPDLTIPPQTVTVPAGKSEVVKLTAPWATAKLWWPDDPRRYHLDTTLHVKGSPVDVLRTAFGFREWGWTGTAFTLNGMPWYFRADLRHTGRQQGRGGDEAVTEWRKNGQNMTRYWGDLPWTGSTQAETLDFFDAAGVPVRRSGIFDGEVASYQLVIDGKANTELFDNWRLQLAAWVKAERNHPSVFVWSLENEITYINARNFGWLKQVEPEIQKAAAEVMKLDPTRPAMIDGGDALMDQSLPVAGNHYLERDKHDYPDEAYTLAKAYARHTAPRPWDPWPIPKDKPLFLGESFFANGSPPAAYAEIIGESAFLGRREAAAGVTRFARMLSEGYRWHGVAAFHFWFEEGANAEHYKAWQPVVVLCKEWDTAFPAGTSVGRTLKVFNDTLKTSPITVHWLFQTRNAIPATQLRGKKTLNLSPGTSEEFRMELAMPTLPAGTKADGDLILTCEREGKQVFIDRRPIRIYAEPTKLQPAAASTVALWDPANKVTEAVRSLTSFTPVTSPDAVPKDCKALVVGPDAITPELATDTRWKGLAAQGVRVVVLDQTNPLYSLAVPADVEPTTNTGRIAFPENLQHPIFVGLVREDFSFWSNGNVVYKLAYRKPSRGGRSLIQCDTELSNTALVEVPVGDGVMILSQLAIGEKPNDPVARRVLANALRYALEYKPAARQTAVLLPENDPRLKLLAGSGLQFTPTDDLAAALEKFEIVIADATPKLLQQLGTMPEALKAFKDAGRWLVLWGVTPDGLREFNKLVGFDHVIRPFKLERVRFPVNRDPLAAGLSLKNVALESAEKIYPWAGDRYPANDTFSHVVDLDDIAPFVKPRNAAHGWSQMTNGLTSADSWKFIFYHDLSADGARPSWVAELPKDEEVSGLSVIVNAHYRAVTRLRVVFDNDRVSPVILDLKPEAELKQDFTFAPRRCRTIALEPLSWSENVKPVIGIDNLWLKVRRPADFDKRVVPLLNIGALVKYPQGQGGILLCQVQANEAEANPINRDLKRTLVATLLQNLGATFAAERVIVPGSNLAYSPIPIGEKCNTFLRADKGWPFGPGDLAQFPVGEQAFGGVRFDVQDVRTSPLPQAISTAKPVNGITVNRPADVLYFLHTMSAKPGAKIAGKPVVWKYLIRYKDGQEVEVPATLGSGVGAWLADAPTALPDAVVAWSAAGPGGKKAAVYLMPWTNPRPGQAIASIDILPAADAPGTGVVLGITAASLKK